MRKSLVAIGFASLTLGFVRADNAPADPRASAIHRQAITIDAHIDIRDDFASSGALTGRDTADAFDLPKLERGGLDVAVVSLFADPAKATPENVAAARQQVDAKLAALTQFVQASKGRVEFARTTADIQRIAGQGRHAVLLSFLNTLPIGEDLSLLAKYRDAGVRVFGFVHAQNTPFADSSRPNQAYGDVPNEHGGLTALGRQAVLELNRLGVVIDVSQLTPAGVAQTLELSRAPVIASHSGLRSRVDVPRNLGDDELRNIAKRGGVVHVVAFSAYLKESKERAADYTNKVWAPFGLKQGVDDPRSKLSPADYTRFQAAYRQYSTNAWRYATVADYVDSVDAAVKLVGIDHVGLSSDFNHGGGVQGYANVGEAGAVTAELVKRGYTESDIDKLWGGNFLRVLGAAERVAQDRKVAFVRFGP
jgi:microsomal dipeptidase-like Zn-dependent dipeptidase